MRSTFLEDFGLAVESVVGSVPSSALFTFSAISLDPRVCGGRGAQLSRDWGRGSIANKHFAMATFYDIQLNAIEKKGLAKHSEELFRNTNCEWVCGGSQLCHFFIHL